MGSCLVHVHHAFNIASEACLIIHGRGGTHKEGHGCVHSADLEGEGGGPEVHRLHFMQEWNDKGALVNAKRAGVCAAGTHPARFYKDLAGTCYAQHALCDSTHNAHANKCLDSKRNIMQFIHEEKYKPKK